MKAKCYFVKVDCLAAKIGKKTPVDMVGIVTDVGSLGSIKRQHDGTEFVRRCSSCSCNLYAAVYPVLVSVHRRFALIKYSLASDGFLPECSLQLQVAS